jgi:hypothetical protein
MSEQISSPGGLSACKIKSEQIKRTDMNITPLKQIQRNNEDNLQEMIETKEQQSS